jgi:hypothetical protein
MTQPRRHVLPGRQAKRRILVLATAALVAGFAVVAVSGAAAIGARLAHGRPLWLTVAAALELISTLGFVAAFQLVFGEWLSAWKSLRAGLAVRAATIVLPAGGLLAIGAGARALRQSGMPSEETGRRTVAFLLITNAPNLIVLAIVGLALGAGLLDGPHALTLTVLPGAIAAGAIGLTLAPTRLVPSARGAGIAADAAPRDLEARHATGAGCHRGADAVERPRLEAARCVRLLRRR